MSQSGWFSHPGLAHGKLALQHVIAKKAGVPYDVFTTLIQAVYMFDYRKSEKVFLSVQILTSFNTNPLCLLH